MVRVARHVFPPTSPITVPPLCPATTPALVRNITFQDSDAGAGEYGGVVTITPPDSEFGVVKYGLFFANRLCTGTVCTITLVPISTDVPLAGSSGVVNVTIPGNTMVHGCGCCWHCSGCSLVTRL
jgi:hypothetical protein